MIRDNLDMYLKHLGREHLASLSRHSQDKAVKIQGRTEASGKVNHCCLNRRLDCRMLSDSGRRARLLAGNLWAVGAPPGLQSDVVGELGDEFLPYSLFADWPRNSSSSSRRCRRGWQGQAVCQTQWQPLRWSGRHTYSLHPKEVEPNP